MRAAYTLIRKSEPNIVTGICLPVTNPVERLCREIKRRAGDVGVFPSEAPIIRLTGAVLFEQNDKWQTAGRDVMAEAFAEIDADETDPIFSLSTQAA